LDQLSQAFGKVAEEKQKTERATAALAALESASSKQPLENKTETEQVPATKSGDRSREAIMLTKAVTVAAAQGARLPLAEANVNVSRGGRSKKSDTVFDEDCIGPGIMEQLLKSRCPAAATAPASSTPEATKPKHTLFPTTAGKYTLFPAGGFSATVGKENAA